MGDSRRLEMPGDGKQEISRRLETPVAGLDSLTVFCFQRPHPGPLPEGEGVFAGNAYAGRSPTHLLDVGEVLFELAQRVFRRALDQVEEPSNRGAFAGL